ncbi:purine-nucleoside phosphorylase [Cyclobacterium amurskyense]|uniref:Purine nucleoside phosphorylase n=1 Tax=Cyclobacterium amurskyense TaxID=320787 RepID=A0A0H4PGV4_9BACT|nr:purine-nucleoside phosphorylase [Cyclobacterium amurskyense]AKP52063.1 Purine nucleoside phosphorylase [Cyclobacterium amurskyense]|tara:strand:+ start:39559 stop:40395 length:837 start_codon:yes stop_codon:yes gene_type:complete
MHKDLEISYLEKINQAVAYLKEKISQSPDTGIVLGTGLGGLLHDIEIITEIPYQEIPHFPIATVTSHQGKLILGRVENKIILAMKGRFHYYEGYSMKEVTFPIRIMKMLGIQTLMLSNASGGLNPEFEIGDIMVIEDHIDLFPENPLRGQNLDQFGDRFPDMSEAYCKEMIQLASEIAQQNNISLRKGVYAGVQGPNLETPAEYRYLRTIGADAVGMSTVPEVIVAAQSGMKVFAVSAITDLCTPGNIKKINLPDILQAAAKAEPSMRKVLLTLLKSS